MFNRLRVALFICVFISLSHSFGAKVLTIALDQEPPNINSTKSTDQVSIFVLGHIMEGLTKFDEKGNIVPGVAERWELKDSGATLWLRKNAKWSDGTPIKAQDFVFAWQTAIDPKTASEYSFIMYVIKNAEAINKGKMGVTELGVKAVNDSTLEVTFEKPCAYFLSLLAFVTYLPIKEEFYKKQNGAYAADYNKMLFSGPFKLTKWEHGASLKFEKNPQYWNSKNIFVDIIDVPYLTPDTTARFNLFKDKKIDYTLLDSDTMKNALKEKYQIKKFTSGSVFFIEFNHREGRPTKNKNLRKALQLVYDQKELVNKVLAIPGNIPGKSLFPSWVPGNSKKFRAEYPVKPVKLDLTKSKEYLEKAKKELGGEIPALVLLTGDTQLTAKEAEYFQSLFKKTLGLTIKIDKQTFKQRLAKMTAGDFDMVSAGWGPDYYDAMTFADLFTSWNENNRGRYKNEEYDKLIIEAQNTTNAKQRFDAIAKVQDIIIDETVILPSYEQAIIYVHSDRVDGIVRSVVGADPNFTYVRVK